MPAVIANPSFRSALVLGGARSGKSRHAEALVTAAGPAPWAYIATAEAGDDEMRARIAEHQARRGAGWVTLEAPLDLCGALMAGAEAGSAVLVDCLTLWLANLMAADRDPEAEQQALVMTLAAVAQQAPVVLVSNEVGLGIVPDNALARTFRDAAGRLNQAVAAACDHAVFMAAGLPMVLKPAG